jgi:hypothetical protein
VVGSDRRLQPFTSVFRFAQGIKLDNYKVQTKSQDGTYFFVLLLSNHALKKAWKWQVSTESLHGKNNRELDRPLGVFK